MTRRALALDGLKAPKPPRRKRTRRPKPSAPPSVDQQPFVHPPPPNWEQILMPNWNYATTTTTDGTWLPPHTTTTATALPVLPAATRTDIRARVRRARVDFQVATGRSPKHVVLGRAEADEVHEFLHAQFGDQIPSMPIKLDGLSVVFAPDESLLEVRS